MCSQSLFELTTQCLYCTEISSSVVHPACWTTELYLSAVSTCIHWFLSQKNNAATLSSAIFHRTGENRTLSSVKHQNPNTPDLIWILCFKYHTTSSSKKVNSGTFNSNQIWWQTPSIQDKPALTYLLIACRLSREFLSSAPTFFKGLNDGRQINHIRDCPFRYSSLPPPSKLVLLVYFIITYLVAAFLGIA